MTSLDNPRFADKVAFVTGAGSGIGRACAVAFAREGANIVAVDRTEAHSTTTIQAIEAIGGRSLAVGCDVTSNTDVEGLCCVVRSGFALQPDRMPIRSDH
jgi:NAD(P)-dependent dehydrogenase (short-subunit alcohol dehydrogenase family)